MSMTQKFNNLVLISVDQPAQPLPPPAPPAKFQAPIVVPDAPAPNPTYLPPSMMSKPTYLPPDMMPAPSGSHFLPTIPPTESSSANPVIDLLAFPPHVNSSYLPTELDAIKHSIDSNQHSDSDDSSNETTYTPPEDLYNFPPNLGSKYLPPDAMMRNIAPINSYLPPASGDEIDEGPQPVEQAYIPPPNLHNFPPNIDSSYLPPGMQPQSLFNSYLPPASGDDTGGYDSGPQPIDTAVLPPSKPDSGSELDNRPPPYMYNKPAPSPFSGSGYMYMPPKDLNNFPPNIGSTYLPPDQMKQLMANVNSYLPPASGSVSGFNEGSKANFPGPMAPSGPYPPAMMPAMMPSAPSAPMMMDDHDHHHDHTAPDFSSFHDHHSDIIYDFDPHDHHHHHDEPPPETTPAAAEEPRVKKYSYYYLGRKLWYVPLYFTLWFCLYVAALIIRSIGRHKVN